MVFLRVLPFEDYYILSGRGYFFFKEATPFIKLLLANASYSKESIKLNPRFIAEIFLAQKKPEQLPAKERFWLLCKEGGLRDEEIKEIMERIREEALNKGDFLEIQKELIAKISPFYARLKELIQVFMDLWNGFLSEEKGYVERGPIENILVSAAMNYVQRKINLKKYRNEERVSEEAEKLMEKWLDKPLEELGGRAPREVILEERQRRGDPEKKSEI